MHGEPCTQTAPHEWGPLHPGTLGAHSEHHKEEKLLHRGQPGPSAPASRGDGLSVEWLVPEVQGKGRTATVQVPGKVCLQPRGSRLNYRASFARVSVTTGTGWPRGRGGQSVKSMGLPAFALESSAIWCCRSGGTGPRAQSQARPRAELAAYHGV